LNFIEIKDGLSIEKSKIVGLEKLEDADSPIFETLVHTTAGTFTSTFPYMTLLDILGREEEPKEKVIGNLDAVLQNVGHLAS
jgi:hypothetical protein